MIGLYHCCSAAFIEQNNQEVAALFIMNKRIGIFMSFHVSLNPVMLLMPGIVTTVLCLISFSAVVLYL